MLSARYGWLLAVITGLGLALSFPYPGLHFLVWVTLVPVIIASVSGSAWRRWWTGFVAGFVWRIGTLYWVAHVMMTYSDMSATTAAFVAGLLGAWMALSTG